MVIQAPRKASHCQGSGGKEIELAGGRRVLDDQFDAAGEAGDEVADVQHAAHDDAHLDEIEDGDREHAAEGGVGEDDGGAEDHAGGLADEAAGDDVEDEAERLDLRRHPAEIGGDDAQRRQHLDRAVVAQAEIVAQGQDVEVVELPGEKDAGDDQAQRRAEGVGDDTAQALLDEGGGNAEHRLGAEPGGEDGGGDDRQRQVAAGDREVLGGMHARGDVEADTDGQHQVENDEPDQHVARPKGWILGLRKL
jgi:hypothetical protein